MSQTERTSRLAIADAEGNVRSDLLKDPYSFYSYLRTREPVRFDPSLRGWTVARHCDCLEALKHPSLSSERTNAYLSELPAVDRTRFRRFVAARRDMVIFCEGERHKRLRVVTRRALGSVAPSASQIIHKTAQVLVDAISSRDTVDLISDFALALPISVLLQLLGVPDADGPAVQMWATAFNLAIGGVIATANIERAEIALDELSSYLTNLILERPPPDTLLAALYASHRNHELSSDELLACCLMLVTAGHETTTNAIGNALLALCDHPAAMTDLRQHPDAIPSSVEELLRYDAPVQLTAREAIANVELAGQLIPQGARVIPLWGSANRDPAVFSRPNVLDFSRDTTRHLGFGAGRHRCAGASLARLEIGIALQSLLQRFRVAALVSEPQWKNNFSFRGLPYLSVVLR